ncbi:hypothetical protein DAPPUDRAFT_65219, partial [Daphnia pulex]
CDPNPCGTNAQCKSQNGAINCVCPANYVGDPYSSCRPECVLNTDCPRDKNCVNSRCVDPCPGTCGINAICRVTNHIPVCSCKESHTGDPYGSCRPIPPPTPCDPNPCGTNAQCKTRNGAIDCSCPGNYVGDPYSSCRPECVLNTDCPRDQSCSRNRCIDPCPGTCGLNADCRISNHIPVCTINCVCPASYIGDPYSSCRPECVLNTDCPRDKNCLQNQCVDPCVGTCGFNADCRVSNHLPVCSCKESHTGDPYGSCRPIPVIIEPNVVQPPTPCDPNPCGTNAQCNTRNGAINCVCPANYVGDPYSSCRPECVLNTECPRDKNCVNYRCVNPCPGTCGINAVCRVTNHIPVCSCKESHTGDPYGSCRPIPVKRKTRNSNFGRKKQLF